MSKSKWEPPRTSRVYLHPMHAGRLITLYPDFKLTNLDLADNGKHLDQNGCGLLFLTGDDPEMIDYKKTVFEPVHDGLPIYTMYNRASDSGCRLTMTAFASKDENPAVWAELIAENDSNTPASGIIAVLPRTAKQDHYLTGLRDTGYDSYLPNPKLWYLMRDNQFNADGLSARSEDGYCEAALTAYDNFTVKWISRRDQPLRFSAQDYYRTAYTLKPGEKAVLRAVFKKGGLPDLPDYESCFKDTLTYWQDIQSKITVFPDTPDIRIRNMYRQNITQCLQMLQKYEGSDYIYPRQGDVGRFIWPWEAVHMLAALDKAGLCSYAGAPYRLFFEKWQIKEGKQAGKIFDPYVNWDNTEGSVLWGVSVHLRCTGDLDEFEYFRPYLIRTLDYISKKRGAKGLFPAGRASDWNEIGQHWVYTDAVNVMGLRELSNIFEYFGAEETDIVRRLYEDYDHAVKSVIAELYAGHENDPTFIFPHIYGLDFEKSWNHCFYTDGAPYLTLLGQIDPNSHIFEQMEAFYRKNGLFEHALAGRMTNATDGYTGLYGDVYYTGVAEICWIYPWLARSEYKKAAEMTEAMLRYNMTSEFIVSERYCSSDPWFTPWQPNGSGSGRIVSLLLDYYKDRDIKYMLTI